MGRAEGKGHVLVSYRVVIILQRVASAPRVTLCAGAGSANSVTALLIALGLFVIVNRPCGGKGP
jgi:hypothetical protein